MGVFQKKPKRIPYEVREDIRRLDQRIAQIEFLQKQDISTILDSPCKYAETTVLYYVCNILKFHTKS